MHLRPEGDHVGVGRPRELVVGVLREQRIFVFEMFLEERDPLDPGLGERRQFLDVFDGPFRQRHRSGPLDLVGRDRRDASDEEPLVGGILAKVDDIEFLDVADLLGPAEDLHDAKLRRRRGGIDRPGGQVCRRGHRLDQLSNDGPVGAGDLLTERRHRGAAERAGGGAVERGGNVAEQHRDGKQRSRHGLRF